MLAIIKTHRQAHPHPAPTPLHLSFRTLAPTAPPLPTPDLVPPSTSTSAGSTSATISPETPMTDRPPRSAASKTLSTLSARLQAIVDGEVEPLPES